MSTIDGSEVGTTEMGTTMRRTASSASTKVDNAGMSRGGTLRKRQSLKKSGSLVRRGSRKSLRAGSIKGMRDDEDSFNSVFHTPIPTTGNPTEVLANRFQAWRKLLKDLITYFREIQTSYEQRSKSLLKVSNVLNNTTAPSIFASEGGLEDAARILRGFHKHSVAEANKSKEIQSDVIAQLNGLRSDLSQKIKEIKSLSGDFKNSVEKEKDGTRKTVAALQDALAVAESDPSSATGKNDPFIVRLAVERQVEKQIEEENYLHRAYLNLEGSGRELESIVVGEIQKAYNAYASILKREADAAHSTIDDLRAGPVGISKDHEWDLFVEHDPHFVNPHVPLRQIEDVHYPGKLNPAASEIRAGMLERKSKYLKSYTPGWYVLSPTHLHEFKSADHIYTQQPVMSLCLLDQRLGSRSAPDASSHKFSLKGRQSGGIHRGHSWVFRAESYDTMMAWYEDIRNLTEKSGPEKNEYVRRHARSISAGSQSAPSISSDGVDDDEADEVPFSAKQPAKEVIESPVKRPSPGGRFPSDIDINRVRDLPNAPSQSSGSSYQENVTMMTSALAQSPPIARTMSINQVQEDLGSPFASHLVHSGPTPSLPAQETAEPMSSNADSSVVDQRASEVTFANRKRQGPHDPQTSDLVERKPSTSNAKTNVVHEDMFEDDEAKIATLPEQSASTGDESEGAKIKGGDKESSMRRTGQFFPSVLRHDTTLSVGELHVPGEWTTTT